MGLTCEVARKTFNSFCSFLSLLLLKFSIIVLYETWLTEHIDFGFDIPGYKHIDIYRNNFGGGIKVFYCDEFQVEIIKNLSFCSNILEVLTFKLFKNGIRYIVCTIYRPPHSNPNLFIDVLMNGILNNFTSSDRVLIVGDINFNLFNPLKLRYIDDFINSLLCISFFPIITIPTKLNDNSIVTRFSLIDQIWSNFKYGYDHISGVIRFSLTDHYPIFYVFKDKSSNHVVETIKCRLINQVTITKFIESVNNFSFDEVLDISDVNDAFSRFYKYLFNLYDKAMPVVTRKIKKKTHKAPWITKKLKICIKRKYYLYNLYRRGLIRKREFNVYKNVLVYVTNKIKKLYYMKKFENSRDVRNTWKDLNSLLRRSGGAGELLLVDDRGVDVSRNRIPNHFNRYFTGVVSRLIAGLPREVDWHYFRRIPTVLQSCIFVPTHFNEINEIISNFSNKGNALFDIKSKILKLISCRVIPFLVFFYNKCISEGIYPDILKIARVVPIYKAGCHKEVTNYRPISILPIINKDF